MNSEKLKRSVSILTGSKLNGCVRCLEIKKERFYNVNDMINIFKYKSFESFELEGYELFKIEGEKYISHIDYRDFLNGDEIFEFKRLIDCKLLESNEELR